MLEVNQNEHQMAATAYSAAHTMGTSRAGYAARTNEKEKCQIEMCVQRSETA